MRTVSNPVTARMVPHLGKKEIRTVSNPVTARMVPHLGKKEIRTVSNVSDFFLFMLSIFHIDVARFVHHCKQTFLISLAGDSKDGSTPWQKGDKNGQQSGDSKDGSTPWQKGDENGQQCE
ncbi:uncharacterized protein LOC124309487 [Neodiprion virginianus]|uniref:uncharacterized protein LOC124309485 n=1 Tax=Neodiprion virginianus TaxID=2961670 RepID=UPI001EE7333E|nr:uncharacterized protein LOC124309485 [Neodiprion virginianus]XP_046629110.1 uncharacterized protein LOC124309487 [Neodiprion virginianus]